MKYIFLLGLVVISHWSIGQDKCGTMEFNGPKSELEQLQQQVQFEDWLQRKISQKQFIKRGRGAELESSVVYEIPVVVHVVHRSGVDVDSLENIPFGQINSQINTLNEDFRRMNADQVDTPADFLDDAADVKVEFVLARRDPEGLPTNGIVRVIGNQNSYSINDAEELAANSYWPAEEYLNIWVARLSSGLLGFAKFPVSNEPGMDEDPNFNRLIDGVYVDYEYFGTGFNADDFSKGRTLTHEIGHWLGLRHIWGDGGCGVDDYCGDTPVQGSSSSGCPPVDQESCSSVDMFQNYMDYTDDVCMNLFTNCQGDRMRTVLENSPRRKELLSSLGGQEAVEVANDLGIRSIVTPTFGNCSVFLEPQIEVRNYGTNDISDFSIDIIIDGELFVTDSFIETLIPTQSIFINLSEISNVDEIQEIEFKVNAVNAGTDGNADNNCEAVSVFFPDVQTAPLSEDFEGSDESITTTWKLKNSHLNASAWSFAAAPNNTIENRAAVLSYFGSSADSFGELDYLLSPVFDLTDLPTADLKFKYAYANHPTNLSDALTVVVSTDCGATFPVEHVLFHQIGQELSTGSSSSESFVPTDKEDWEEVEINFGEYLGEEVVIAFVGSNGLGNNIFIDDIQIYSSAAFQFDVGISKVESIPVVTCERDISLDIYVKNFGSDTITEFSLTYDFNNTFNSINIDSNFSLPPGKSELIEVNAKDLQINKYQLDIIVEDPNGVPDQNPSNNSYSASFEIDTVSEFIPIRQKFAKTLEATDWYYHRADTIADWTINEFRENNISDYALSFPGYEVSELGIENWAVSTILDFSLSEEASMTFDISYASKNGRNDRLRVLASTDCGRSYDLELYNKMGSELAITQSESAWVPASDDDWRNEFVDLSELVGVPEVRLAFVVTNQNGNNLYLDNIEVYVSQDEDPLQIVESMRCFPNPASEYIEVKFNFNIKEEILLRVVSLQGEVIAEESFPNTLNQIYRIEPIQSTRNGMYIIQAIGQYTNLSNKVLIHK